MPRGWLGASSAVVAALLPLVVGYLVFLSPLAPLVQTIPGTGILASQQKLGTWDYFEVAFVLPAPTPSTLLAVDTVASVNVTCGGPSWFAGSNYTCSVSLVRGPTGGHTMDLLWEQPFTGRDVAVISHLTPGLYTFLVNVWIGGTPGSAQIVTSFDVVVEALEVIR